jgi:hypothetical protein
MPTTDPLILVLSLTWSYPFDRKVFLNAELIPYVEDLGQPVDLKQQPDPLCESNEHKLAPLLLRLLERRDDNSEATGIQERELGDVDGHVAGTTQHFEQSHPKLIGHGDVHVTG